MDKTKVDDAMRTANVADAGIQSVLGFERLRRLAQGNSVLTRQATAVGKAYARKAGVAGLAIEAGNAAWLAADPDKRARASADFETNAKKPALERAVEGAINATDTIFATGKTAYDAGKTYESIERSQMDEINNSLLRKIAKHEAESAEDRLGVNPMVERRRSSPLLSAYLRSQPSVPRLR